MSYLDDLERLSSLRKRKLITEEEFELQKAILLEKGKRQHFEKDNSEEPKTVEMYCILGWLFGVLGGHNFYVGKVRIGIIQFVLGLFRTSASY